MSEAAFPDGLDARRLIETLGLAPHPEGGFYRETFRDDRQTDDREVAPGRAASTAIYFLLEAGRASAWHRIDATEIWLFHAGAPLLLSLSADGRTTTGQRLGSDILAGERPQAVVPAHCWQAARTLGAWTLASCVVAPGFDFAKFELAPEDFAPAAAGAEP
jgi:predicted cupin superfamily sugar epimerase